MGEEGGEGEETKSAEKKRGTESRGREQAYRQSEKENLFVCLPPNKKEKLREQQDKQRKKRERREREREGGCLGEGRGSSSIREGVKEQREERRESAPRETPTPHSQRRLSLSPSQSHRGKDYVRRRSSRRRRGEKSGSLSFRMEARCPHSRWIHAVGLCYRSLTAEGSHSECSTLCGREGAAPACPRSAAQQRAIVELIGRVPHSTGIHRQTEESPVFVCPSGEETNGSAITWAEGNPHADTWTPHHGCAILGRDGALHDAPCLGLYQCLCEWPAQPSAQYSARIAHFERMEHATLTRLHAPYLAVLSVVATLPSLLFLVCCVGSVVRRACRRAAPGTIRTHSYLARSTAAASRRLTFACGALHAKSMPELQREDRLDSKAELVEAGAGAASAPPTTLRAQSAPSLAEQAVYTDPRAEAIERAVHQLRLARRASWRNRLRISVPTVCLGLALHVLGITAYVLPPWPAVVDGVYARVSQPLFVLTPLIPTVVLAMLALLPTDGAAIRLVAFFISILLVGITPPFLIAAVQTSSLPTAREAVVEGAVESWAYVALHVGGICMLFRVAFASSSRLPARRALSRLCGVLRGLLLADGAIVAVSLGLEMATFPIAPSPSDPRRAAQAVEAAFFLLAGALTTAACRRRFHARLLRGDDQRCAAALIAAMVGHGDLQCALQLAQERFMMVSLEHLGDHDLDSSDDSGLGLRASPAVLGEVDAFVSHSWHDDGAAKTAALRKWAASFVRAHGRSPTLWIDKGCIDQKNVSTDLAALPIYLLGCRSLVVLLGPTYCERLWCVLEVFAFLQMGGKREDIHVMRLQSCDSTTNLSFGDFRVDRSSCALDTDKQRLLGAIEAGFGDLADFNRTIRDIFGSRPERV